MRTIEYLREKWRNEKPFYYSLDHEAVGLLFARIDALEKELRAYVGDEHHALCGTTDNPARPCDCGLDVLNSAQGKIVAQHEETGRMWEGPPDQIPHGYSAVDPTDDITITDLRGVEHTPPY